MSEALEKQLINIFTMAWGDAAPSMIGAASSIGLIAQRDVVDDEVRAALDIVPAFTSGFAATCSGAMSGILLCFFKREDRQKIELFISKMGGEQGTAAISSLLNWTLKATASSLPEPVTFSDFEHVDLSGIDIVSHLTNVIAGKASINTLSLTVGDRLNSQMLVVYAPLATVEALQSIPPANDATTEATSAVGIEAAAAAGATTSGFGNKRRTGTSREDASRNIERLLDVELEVIVRFGLTQIPLRELVRIGVGSMIELNRQVDEPVELLVNNRPLARGSVVVVDGYYGVCITEIGQIEERRQSLTKA